MKEREKEKFGWDRNLGELDELLPVCAWNKNEVEIRIREVCNMRHDDHDAMQ